MDKAVGAKLSVSETAQIRAEIQEYIAEMQRSNERIKKDQQEIERLKTKTRATLAELTKLRGI